MGCARVIRRRRRGKGGYRISDPGRSRRLALATRLAGGVVPRGLGVQLDTGASATPAALFVTRAVPGHLARRVVGEDPGPATLARESAGAVDRFEGLAEVAGERAGGGDGAGAGLDPDGAVAAGGGDEFAY